MKLLISDISALQLWDRGAATWAHPVAGCSIDDFRVDLRSLRQLDPGRFGLDVPAYLMVPHTQTRPWSAWWHGRYWGKALPGNAVYQVDDGVYLASPELVFAQIAPRLGWIDSIKLGMELCGMYSTLVPPGEDFLQRPPLTRVVELASFVRCLYPRSDNGMMMRALSLVADNAESPMECASRILLCLRYRYGCPGFPKPLMNYEISLGQDEQRLLRKRKLRCDAYWDLQRVALEYKGVGSHGGESNLRNDTARESILVARGVTVVPATYASIASEEGFSCLCEALSRALGKRLRFPEGYVSRQRETRAMVLRGNTCSWVK